MYIKGELEERRKKPWAKKSEGRTDVDIATNFILEILDSQSYFVHHVTLTCLINFTLILIGFILCEASQFLRLRVHS